MKTTLEEMNSSLDETEHTTDLHGERTRDCSPGHAGKEGPQLARTGVSLGFPRAAAPVGVFSRGTTRISGSLSCGARVISSASVRMKATITEN